MLQSLNFKEKIFLVHMTSTTQEWLCSYKSWSAIISANNFENNYFAFYEKKLFIYDEQNFIRITCKMPQNNTATIPVNPIDSAIKKELHAIKKNIEVSRT